VAAWGAAVRLIALRKFYWLPLDANPDSHAPHRHRRKTMAKEV
jgi:hypothetical protein